MIRIYIDADGCPVKQEVYKVAERYKLQVAVVANKQLSLPSNPLFEMVVVTGAFDAADDWIVENARPDDIVITADILLADKAFDADERVLAPLAEAGKTAVIPPKANRKISRTYDRDLFKARHLIENFFARLKQFSVRPRSNPVLTKPSQHQSD